MGIEVSLIAHIIKSMMCAAPATKSKGLVTAQGGNYLFAERIRARFDVRMSRRELCLLICGFILIHVFPMSGQVVFSRWEYKEQGRSYQQIWLWNAADGSLKQLSDSARGHFKPVCMGKRILFVSPEGWQENARLWSFDRLTRQERIVGAVPGEQQRESATKGCAVAASSGSLLACGNGKDIAISRDGKPTGRVHAGERGTPILWLEWSPDRNWLLAATLGWETNSSSPQSDYYVVRADASTVIQVGSGNDGMWVPGRNQILYVSPRDLALLRSAGRRREVWVAHLMLFDLETKKTSAITSGTRYGMDARTCGDLR
jgi:hypothetical protein